MSDEEIAHFFERIALSLIFLQKTSDSLRKPMREFPALVLYQRREILTHFLEVSSTKLANYLQIYIYSIYIYIWPILMKSITYLSYVFGEKAETNRSSFPLMKLFFLRRLSAII